MSNPYNQLHYPGFVRPQAHPRRLEAIARLHGMTPPPIATCRVLELGCGDGIHLMGIAAEFPDCRCVGIDLAESGIVHGRRILAEAGIPNVRLEQADILDIGPEFGAFDYIIAHGIYSWVPAAVKDKLLAICGSNLAPNGVAFVSYSALPGAHMRRMLDEMLAWHVRNETSPEEQVRQARDISAKLAQWAGPKSLFGTVLASENRRLATLEDFSIYHDDLSPCNTPLFFSAFVAHAQEHGLQYLGDAHPADLELHRLSPASLTAIENTAKNRIEWEQYVDFVEGTAFRQTLLCHATAVIQDSGEENMDELHVAGKLSWAEGADLTGPGEVAFSSELGVSVTLNQPLLKQALVCLDQAWPGSLTLADWHQRLRETGFVAAADPDSETSRALLHTLALKGRKVGLLDLWATPMSVATEAGQRPRTSALARWQAKSDGAITNLRAQEIQSMPAFPRRLLQLLDGRRCREEIGDILWADCEQGHLELPPELIGSANPKEQWTETLEALFQNLIRLALLLK